MIKSYKFLFVSLLILILLITAVYLFRSSFFKNKTGSKNISPNQKIEIANKDKTKKETDDITTNLYPEKTYRNNSWGFEFGYNRFGDREPQNPDVFSNKNETQAKEYNFAVYLFSESSSFNWFLNNGTSSFPLGYDRSKNEWKISLGLNMTEDEMYCPTTLYTKSQNVPYYLIGDSRSGRSHDFVYVTKNGLIVLSTPYMDPKPEEIIKFDNPQAVIPVKCPL